MNIEGLGKKVIENFWNLNFLKLPQDIYKLDFNKISKLEGWGKLSADNLKKSIEKTKKINLRQVYFFTRHTTYRTGKCKNFSEIF